MSGTILPRPSSPAFSETGPDDSPENSWGRALSTSEFEDSLSDVGEAFGPSGPSGPTEDVAVDFGTKLTAESPHALQRRRLMDILIKLHRTGVQHDIDLPQIVVIGSQSVGKSSLIESMSGITLPRDSGTCTRCPMECKLSYSKEPWTCSILLRFQVDNNGRPLDRVIEKEFGSPLTDKAEVEEMLRRAQRAILRPTLSSSLMLDDLDLHIHDPPPLSFSANCVCLRVSGPQVSDLFFYDLPGIITNVGENGNPTDIDLIRNLVMQYISKERCLILLTVSCETDFENQGAVLLARHHDRGGKRIIGVLTKPDRVEHGARRWLAMIRGDENHLVNGWFSVKLPSPVELAEKITWEEARRREIAFFKEKEPWNKLPNKFSKRLGSGNLTGHLSRLLSKLVEERLPQIEDEIDRALFRVDVQLDELPVPMISDPSGMVTSLVFQFCQEVSRRIEGTVQFPGQQLGLMQSIHKFHLRFNQDIRDTAPKLCPWEKRHGSLPEVPLKAKREQQRIGFTPLANIRALASEISDDEEIPRPAPPPLSSSLATWVKDPNFIAPEEQSGNFLDRVGPVFYLEEVMALAEDSVARELPGDYPFSVKEELIKLFIKEWKQPMLDCFRRIERTLKSHVASIITDCFGPYAHGGLLSTVRSIIEDILRRLQQSTLARLESHLAIEGRPFTLNAHYFKEYKEKFLTHYRDIRRQSQGQEAFAYKLQQQSGNATNTVNYFHNIGLGFTITQADLIRLLPYDKMETALDIIASVRAYYQVAYKRFLDAVPLEIDTGYIRAFESRIREALILGLNVGSQDQCRKWLCERPEIVARRKELKATKKRLEDARNELASFRSH